MTTSPRRSAMDRTSPKDLGLGLVELIVAIGLFGVLGSILLGLALSTSRATETTEGIANVSEESRLAMERMTRELRQAKAIVAIQLGTTSPTTYPANCLNPDSQLSAFTFWSDFNGNGVKDLNAADPEVLTYRWNPTSDKLTLTANDASGKSVTEPVLAAKVASFSVDFASSSWEYDTDQDSTTDWCELDTRLDVGNQNYAPDGDEVKLIDLVTISMSVKDGSHTLAYRTRVDLRNQNQN